MPFLPPPSIAPNSLDRRIAVARAILAWEALWPRLIAPLCFVALFLAAAHLDVFRGLEAWTHTALLAACAGALIGLTWFAFRGFRWPELSEFNWALDHFDAVAADTSIPQAVRDMAAVSPDAALVYIVRDGRDVLISERFRNFVEDSRFLTAEDKRIIEALKIDQKPFTDGRRSIFNEAFIRRAAAGWVTNLKETDEEGRRLYGERYFTLRYEDLLERPFTEMKKLWQFLGVSVDPALENTVINEQASNPDEEWQARRNDSIASFLPKGKAGNWRNMFTKHDQQVFKETAGEMLVKWGYEKDLGW